MKPLCSRAPWLLAAALSLLPSLASACDLCAVCASLEAKESAQGWYLGLHEQYSRFATLREDGHAVVNAARQKVESSITQAFVGY